jgi:hypothetical protein
LESYHSLLAFASNLTTNLPAGLPVACSALFIPSISAPLDRKITLSDLLPRNPSDFGVGDCRHINQNNSLPYTVCLPGKKSHTVFDAASDFTTRLSCWSAVGLSILLSAMLIPYAGIQDDEALFSNPLYYSLGREFELRAFHHDVPLMIMSYLGTLKTLLYWPWLPLFGASVWAVRLPMAFAGAITVFFFYRLILLSEVRSASQTAALAAGLGAFLLATDPVFLLTNTFDWGPVALEHVLLVTGCFLLARFNTKRAQIEYLAGGFFLFGLALWDKALFLWALGGLAAAAVTVYGPEVRQCLSRRNFYIAAAGLLLGALPFVLYNLRHPAATVGQNAHWEADRLSAKWLQLKNAANGTSLFGFIAEEDWAVTAKPATSVRGRVASWIRQTLGRHRETGFYYVFGVLLAGVPLWWRSRPARFSLVFLCVAFAMMAFTKDAGGAAHHDILLWPFPLLFAAVTVAAIPWRWVAILAGTGLVIMNLLVINQYVVQFEQNGAAGNFTDALIPLARVLPEDGRTVWVLDWGIGNSIQLAHRGRLKTGYGADPLQTDSPSSGQRAQILYMLNDPGAIFVSHVPVREVIAGIPEHLEQFAAASGYRKDLLNTVWDSNGRPVFEVFRYISEP